MKAEIHNAQLGEGAGDARGTEMKDALTRLPVPGSGRTGRC